MRSDCSPNLSAYFWPGLIETEPLNRGCGWPCCCCCCWFCCSWCCCCWDEGICCCCACCWLPCCCCCMGLWRCCWFEFIELLRSWFGCCDWPPGLTTCCIRGFLVICSAFCILASHVKECIRRNALTGYWRYSRNACGDFLLASDSFFFASCCWSCQGHPWSSPQLLEACRHRSASTGCQIRSKTKRKRMLITFDLLFTLWKSRNIVHSPSLWNASPATFKTSATFEAETIDAFLCSPSKDYKNTFLERILQTFFTKISILRASLTPLI